MPETDFSWLVTCSNPKSSTESSSENSWNGARNNGVQVQRVNCTHLSSSSQNGSDCIPIATWRESSGYISNIVEKIGFNRRAPVDDGLAVLSAIARRWPGTTESIGVRLGGACLASGCIRV